MKEEKIILIIHKIIFTSSTQVTPIISLNVCYPCLPEAFEITLRNQNCVIVSKAVGIR